MPDQHCRTLGMQYYLKKIWGVLPANSELSSDDQELKVKETYVISDLQSLCKVGKIIFGRADNLISTVLQFFM